MSLGTAVLLGATLLAGCTAGSTTAGSTTAVTTAAGSTTAATTTTTTASPAPPPDACARAVLDTLDRPARVGQLLLIGVDVTDPGPDYAQVAAAQIGGVFLRGRSSQGAAAVRQAIAALQGQAGPVALQVAVDQEGGNVQTLRGPGFTDIPTATVQAGQSDLAERTSTWAAELAGAGITLDLSPVADVVPAGTEGLNPPIGASARQFGSDPAVVGPLVSTVVTAMIDAGLGTTVKHFPGLGRVRVNTDTSTGAVDDATTPEDAALVPFVAGIAAGTTAVMVSSASYPQLDPDRLAAFSAPIITGLLRGRLGFDGLVVSDDLGDAVAVAALPVGRRAVDFVAAGGDVVLSLVPAQAAPMGQALLARAQADPVFAAQVDASALRVLRAKQDAGLLDC